MFGIDLKWKCLECGHVNNQNLGACDLYSFDGGIEGYVYISTHCNKCGKEHLVTTVNRINYIRPEGIINDYYHKAVVTKD